MTPWQVTIKLVIITQVPDLPTILLSEIFPLQVLIIIRQEERLVKTHSQGGVMLIGNCVDKACEVEVCCRRVLLVECCSCSSGHARTGKTKYTIVISEIHAVIFLFSILSV